MMTVMATMMMTLSLGRNHGTGKDDHSDDGKQNITPLHDDALLFLEPGSGSDAQHCIELTALPAGQSRKFSTGFAMFRRWFPTKLVDPIPTYLAQESLDIDHHCFAVDAQREDIHLLVFRVDRSPRLQMERPGVPGTNDSIAFNPTLGQRRPSMGAPVVQCRELSTYPRQANRHTVHLGLDQLSLCGRLRNVAQPHPLRHTTHLPDTIKSDDLTNLDDLN
jgi:hypothetical protein